MQVPQNRLGLAGIFVVVRLLFGPLDFGVQIPSVALRSLGEALFTMSELCILQMLISCFSGIIPGAGDVADIALNYYLVVRKARQAEYVFVFRSQIPAYAPK